MLHDFGFRQSSVSSGSFVVSRQKKEMLNAYLGTCVGVSICDRHNGVGGLLHLLLAEPISTGIVLGRPENYAALGLPMFINELYKNGAQKEHLKATVAGGVLVGPVSKMDVNLDIGGRTTEVVERILNEEGIPIADMETGGYFSCCLRLNLSNWESSIDLINVPDNSFEVKFIKLQESRLEKIISDVRPIPQIVLKLIRMIQDDSCSMMDLAKEVRQEQVITAKIIRLCNTAFFQQKVKVDSIDRALAVLGEKRLLQLVISASMEDFFPTEATGYSLCKGGLFNHAVGTALMAERLAAITGRAPSEVAYTAGLLHDIGKVALDQYMGQAYPLFYRKIQVEEDNLINVENDIFGVSHTDIGGLLAERWAMPEQLVEVIKYHHDPQKASLSSELAHIVYFADLILSRFMVGHELDRLNTDDFTARLNCLGLTPAKFPELIEHLAEDLFHLSVSEKE
jgi:putative nucleotidyltransferase with HDIG domain